MYDFELSEQNYSLPFDIGGQAALNDLNRWLFNAFQAFPNEEAAWADMRKSEFGQALHEKIMEFDEFEFNGSAGGEDA